ncbi:MAG: TetR/AcrR family transcriptional regulator [Ruminococcus sp.]
MLTTETGTQTRILAAAKTEFLEKGFRNASLRTIVKLAGVTTGAFYGYYSLFCTRRATRCCHYGKIHAGTRPLCPAAR